MLQIHLRNLPPPDETFDHISFLTLMAKWIKPEHYLELGIRDGRCFQSVARNCAKATGVDISQIGFMLESNMDFHCKSTDDYFRSIKGKGVEFDMVFIDADHSHKQSLRDFLNVAPRVIEDGFIFFHDTYPCLPYLFDKTKSDDVYKTALYIKKTLIDQFEIVTLPFNPGVTIVKKIARNKQMVFDNE